MELEINQEELNFLINGVVEELNTIEIPVRIGKALVKSSTLICEGEIERGVKLYEDYIAQYKLLIKLWKLDENVTEARENIEVCRESIQEAKEAITKIKTLTEVPCNEKAECN